MQRRRCHPPSLRSRLLLLLQSILQVSKTDYLSKTIFCVLEITQYLIRNVGHIQTNHSFILGEENLGKVVA